MIVFEIRINGAVRCRAGSEGDVIATLSYIRSPVLADAIARGELPKEVQDPDLSVGGVLGDAHARWLSQKCSVGDEITIRIVESDTADEPELNPIDAEMDQAAKWAAYRALKDDLEGE